MGMPFGILAPGVGMGYLRHRRFAARGPDWAWTLLRGRLRSGPEKWPEQGERSPARFWMIKRSRDVLIVGGVFFPGRTPELVHLIDFSTAPMVVSRGFKFRPVWCPFRGEGLWAERAELTKLFSCSLAVLVRRWSSGLGLIDLVSEVVRLPRRLTFLRMGSAGQFFSYGNPEMAFEVFS